MPSVDIIDGMDYGVGVNLGGKIFGDAVVRTEPVIVGGGISADIFLTLVQSQEDQNRALDLSTEVSAAVGLFGGSAKFDLSQSMHFHQFAITLIIRANVMNAFSQLRDVKFRENGPMTLLRDGHMDRFREQFGDYFVRGMRTGGQFCAILQIIGKDQMDQSDVKATLQAGGILGSVTASTDDSFRSVVQRATSHRETKLRHIQVGGRPSASINPEEMVAHALNFASEVGRGTSEAFTALVIPYETLDRPPGPNYIDVEAARETVDIIMRKRQDTLTRLTEFDFVVTHPEQFEIPSGLDINAIIGRLADAVAKLTSAASRCVDHPGDSSAALQSLDSLVIPIDAIPRRREGSPPPPQRVLVPNFIDLSPQDARDRANAAGLEPIMISHSEIQPFRVASQDPAASTLVDRGTLVRLFLETRPPRPPPYHL